MQNPVLYCWDSDPRFSCQQKRPEDVSLKQIRSLDAPLGWFDFGAECAGNIDAWCGIQTLVTPQVLTPCLAASLRGICWLAGGLPIPLSPVDACFQDAILDSRSELPNSEQPESDGMRLGIAFKAFFAALFDRQMSSQLERLLMGQPVSGADTKPAAEPIDDLPRQPMQPLPSRDPAVTLLATLQREARLIDLIHEDLSRYSDDQVGAAARPCLQQCASVLKRLFELQPVVAAAEGDTVNVGRDASPIRYQWIGDGSAESGKLIHHGWQITKVELPQWSGDIADANVIAPAQVESP